MKKRVLWVILVVSLALNAVFASWFTFDIAANHIPGKYQSGQIAQAIRPGHTSQRIKNRAKQAIKSYIEDYIADKSVYTPVSWKFEKAYVSPYNELSCARAASMIIDLKQHIKNEEATIQNCKRMLITSPDNKSIQMMMDNSENSIKEYKEAIITNERTIIRRSNRQDGRFLGWNVTHTYTITLEDGNQQTITERFIVSSNGKDLSLQQSLDPWNYQNYDRVCEVISDILTDYRK